MTASKSKSKAAESEKDQSALQDESKDTQTTKQAEEQEVPTSAEKRQVDGNDAFEGVENAPVEDDNVDAGEGVVVEVDAEGNEYEVPFVHLSAPDLKPRTSDSDDPAKSWTSQEVSEERKDEDGNVKDPVALVPVDGKPGQTFRVRELPDRKVVEAAGIDYDQWVAGLPVRADVPHEAPRRGIPS